MDYQRDTDGQLSAFAWPGGYPITYRCRDGGKICPTCANSDDFTTDPSPDAITENLQWVIDAQFIHYEGAPIICDNCNTEIPSAYGDD